MVYTLVCHAFVKDDARAIEAFKLKLIEASRIYRNDLETIDWYVMQDVHDQRKFTIVERFEKESGEFHVCYVTRDEIITVMDSKCTSQKYHLENPYWATFDPYVAPLLAKPIEILRHEELDTSADVTVPTAVEHGQVL